MKNILLVLVTLFSFGSTFAQAAGVQFEEDNVLPIVYVNIVIDSGAAQDPQGKLGLANLSTQMLLRGTQVHSKSEFFDLINRLGASLEVEVRNEGTVFRGAVLSENLGKFLELVDEALIRPKFTSEELTKLKKEVEGEILEQKGNDKSLVQLHYSRFLFGSHPYGNPILGTQADVASINYKDIVNYYNQNFGQPTMHLFGTGAANTGTVEKWFNDLVGKLAAIHPDVKAIPEVSTPEIVSGRRILIVDKPKTTQTQVMLGGKGIRPESPGFYAVQLANHSFGGHSFQARLMQELRVKRGWTYGAANVLRYGKKPKSYSLYYFPKTDDTVPAIALSIELFEDFVKNGVTPEQYNFAKDSLVNNAPFNFDTSKKRLENATTEYLMNFPKDYFKNFANNIGKVKFEEIKPALNESFHPENLALTVVGDSDKLKEPLKKLKGFTKLQVKNYLED